jgi:hypothetical protein
MPWNGALFQGYGPSCLTLHPNADRAGWPHIVGLMETLYKERQIDPDVALLHPADEPVLLAIVFRAGLLVKMNPETGEKYQPDGTEEQAVERVAWLSNPVTGKIMPVEAHEDAERGVLALATRDPWCIVARLTHLSLPSLVA